MERTSREILIKKLQEAKKQIEIGSEYIHTKTGGRYIVENIAIREDNEQVRVIYKELLHDPAITWDRLYEGEDGFINTTEIDGKIVPRFTKVKQ